MAKKETFVLNTDYAKRFSSLSFEQMGRLFVAISEYEDTGVVSVEMDAKTEAAFEFVKFDLDENRAKYEQTCEKRRNAGGKGASAKKNQEEASASKCKQMPVNADTCQQVQANASKCPLDNDSDSDNDFKKKNTNVFQKEAAASSARTKFQKPSIEDVKAYCAQRNKGVDAERFLNYYEANGWKVGKNPMKDWKAAVRTWENNGYGGRGSPKKLQEYGERTYTDEDFERLIHDPLKDISLDAVGDL